MVTLIGGPPTWWEACPDWSGGLLHSAQTMQQPQDGLRRGTHLSPQGEALRQAPLQGKLCSHGDYQEILGAPHGPKGGQEGWGRGTQAEGTAWTKAQR